MKSFASSVNAGRFLHDFLLAVYHDTAPLLFSCFTLKAQDVVLAQEQQAKFARNKASGPMPVTKGACCVFIFFSLVDVT